MDRKINLNVSFFTTLRAKRAILILFQNPTFKKHSCNFDHFWRKNSNNGNISDTNIKIVFLVFFPWNSNETFWGIFKHCGNPDWNTVKNYYHRWGEMQFLWFSFFILLQEAAQKWYVILMIPPVQKMTGRHSVSLSLSFSKMQTKLKNALQLSFATCQHSPWFLMTFEMMHQPRIHNSSSSSQFCPISNFNLRCNFLFLHFTVTFTFSVILFASISFRSWEQIVSFFR